MFLVVAISVIVQLSVVRGEEIGPALVLSNDVTATSVPTTTVYGFLDFTTTIDRTVVVFKPSTVASATATHNIAPTATVATVVHVPTRSRPNEKDVTSPSKDDRDDDDDADLRKLNNNKNNEATSSALTSSRRFPGDQVASESSSSKESNSNERTRVLIRKRLRIGRRPNGDNDKPSGTRVPPLRRPVSNKYRLRLRPTPTENETPAPSKDVPETPDREFLLRQQKIHQGLSLQEARAIEVTRSPKEYLPEDEYPLPTKTANSSSFDGNINDARDSEIRGSELDPSEGLYRSDPSSAIDLEASEQGGDQETTGDIVATVPLALGHIAGTYGDSPGKGLTVPLQLSIVTSSFSLTETMLRTSLLPVYDGTSTTYYTLTQSFLVTKTVTSLKTVPPEEFMPYLILGNNSINEVGEEYPLPDGSDHLEHRADKNGSDRNAIPSDNVRDPEAEDDGHNNVNDAGPNQIGNNHPTGNNSLLGAGSAHQGALAVPGQQNPLLGAAGPGGLPFLNLINPGLAAALGINPYLAAAYGLGMGPQVVTTSRPIFSTSVLMTEKLLPVIDGFSTSYETIKAPAGTVTHTSYETYTTTQPQHPALPPALPGLQPQMSTITVPTTYVTTDTVTETQVFKLVYDGYKTSYRTVSSISETVKTIATHTTTTVPAVPTQIYPYFG